jgi:GNAT superfamily N-acetyltransferase
MHLRPLERATDVPAVVALLNTYQSEPATVDQFMGWLERTSPGRDIRRMVAAEADDRVIGYSYADHDDWEPAGRYEVWAVIDPACRGQKAGTMLLEDAIAYARSRGAARLTTQVREIDPDSLRFAQSFGFVFDRHLFESTLDLINFDETPFQAAEEKVAAGGIRICSLAELGNTPENRRKLHAVNHATALDIPGWEGGWMPFEQFEQMVSKADWFRPAGQFGALEGEEWVGMSAVRLIAETRGSYNLMTGVMPAYRGRKIAQTLKLAAIRYAQANGAVYMRTNNDSQNAPMLALNRKLGYMPQPGIYFLRKDEI